MSRIALFPGSFDPFTNGHDSIVRRAVPLFDQLIIGIGHNTSKQGYFSLAQRIDWIKATYQNEPKVRVETFEGLTVDFCDRMGCQFIVRGLRNSSDFDYESAIAQMNHQLNERVQTVFLTCDPAYNAINARIVREIHKSGGDVSAFLPFPIEA